MDAPLTVVLNGQARSFDGLREGATLDELVGALGLKGDRVAVEMNGQIVPRTQWAQAHLGCSDKLELVHFVGGGSRW